MHANPNLDPVENNALRWAYLDRDAFVFSHVRELSGGVRLIKVFVPQMSCPSCVSALEQLSARLKGVQRAEVNFPMRQLQVWYDPEVLKLSALAKQMDLMGFPPDFQEATKKTASIGRRKILARLAVAGFVFGNTMMMAFAEYLGGEEFGLSGFQSKFGWFSAILALPVVFYSGAGYFQSAWSALRSRTLNIDVPVALGIATLWIRSSWEVISIGGMGYFDSLAGLLFFLLIGKWYQSRTHDDMVYERDVLSFFPIQVMRIEAIGSTPGRAVPTPISDLQAGDRIRIHYGEIVPCDARLLVGDGLFDRSFTTGESDPIPMKVGGDVEAGGRQVGGAVELEVVRPVEQSRLTKMWNSETFSPDEGRTIQDPVKRVARHFTAAVLTIALATFGYWILRDASVAWQAFTATLIVACPCALALSLPFTYGSALRALGRSGAFLKDALVVERMAQASVLVFDKTGTLTPSRKFDVRFEALSVAAGDSQHMDLIASLAAQSAHPMSRAIARTAPDAQHRVVNFEESAGNGTRGTVMEHLIKLGSASWTESDPTAAFDVRKGQPNERVSYVYASIDGLPVGRFSLVKPLREGVGDELTELSRNYDLHLVSGDSDADRSVFTQWFQSDNLHFNQRPEGKVAYIEKLQAGKDRPVVAMIGDGLNDAAALRSSDLGVAVVDDLYAFSPASDLILSAPALSQWGEMLRFARGSRRIVWALLIVSFLYNIVGLTFAVQGLLTPVVAAILMPISSMTVVGGALISTRIMARRLNAN